MSVEMNVIKSEEEFENDFTIVDSPSNDTNWDIEDFDLMKETYPTNKIWTVIEDDEGNWIASKGFHIVNVIYWLVTEESWDDTTSDYFWFLNDEL